MEELNKLKDQIEGDLKKIPGVAQIEEQSGVPIIAVAGGVAAVVIILAYLIAGPGFVCNFVGFSFPAYASLKAIESESKTDDTQWLTYCVVYAFFCVIETFVEFIVEYFPYYFILKFFFLIWLFNPVTLGADTIYKQVVRPFLVKNAAQIDSYTSKLEHAVDEGLAATSEMTDNLKGMVQESVNEAVADLSLPAQEESAQEEAPVEEVQAEEAPAEETPAEETPAEESAPAEDAPAEETPAEDS